MKQYFLMSLVLVAGIARALPSVDNVVFSQGDDGVVTVSYSLSGEPAIVCLDILTNATVNGVSIGGENLRRVTGDVNRLVGLGHDFATPYAGSIRWYPFDGPILPHTLSDASTVKAMVCAYPTNSPPDYMVVNTRIFCEDLPSKSRTRGYGVKFYRDEASLPGGLLSNPVYREDHFVLRRIHAKGVTWRHGTPNNSDYADVRNDKYFNFYVQLTNDYYLSVFELSRFQYRTFGWTESKAEADFPSFNDYKWSPHTGISSKSARGEAPDSRVTIAKPTSGYCFELASRTKVNFDIPTYLQWEYACRAGTKGPIYNSESWNTNKLDEICWNKNNWAFISRSTGKPPTSAQPHAVGTKAPNAWGLYDMIGNSHELVRDFYVTNQERYDSLGGKGYAPADPALQPDCLTVADTSSSTNRIRVGSAVGEAVANDISCGFFSVPANASWATIRLCAPSCY